MNKHHALVAVAIAVAICLLASMAGPAFAGGRVFFGVGIGVPFGYPYPYACPYPYAYPYPYPAYSPPVVVEQSAPPVYVQQEAPAAEPAPPQYWYYCQASQAYYPYVKECPAGWMQVVPQASPPAPR